MKEGEPISLMEYKAKKQRTLFSRLDEINNRSVGLYNGLRRLKVSEVNNPSSLVKEALSEQLYDLARDSLMTIRSMGIDPRDITKKRHEKELPNEPA